MRGEGQRAAFREAALQVMLAVAGVLSEGKMANTAELRELSKRALVQEAVARAQASGRKPRANHIAVETGISRNDVAKLMRGTVAAPRALLRGRAIAEYVLSHWWSEVRDKLGRPAPLDMPDVVKLLKRLRISAKRATPIVNELERTGALVRLKDGRLRPIRQSYFSVQRDRKSLLNAGVQARRFLEAMFGLRSAGGSNLRFIRIIESEPLVAQAAARVANEFMEDEQTLLDRTTDSFSRRRYAATPGADAKRIVAAVHLMTEVVQGSETTANAARKKRNPRGTRTAGKRSRSPSGVGVA